MQGASPLASPRLNPGDTGAGGESRTRRGACFLCRPPNPAFGLPSCPPSPRPPSPPGKGENITLFRRGLRPRHPCIKPPAALTDRTEQVPGELNSGSTTRREPLSLRFCGKPWVQPRGCKGRSPLHKKTISLPLPGGKGVGGMGERKHTKSKVGGRQTKQAPRRAPQRQGQPVPQAV